jgi:hypothetical protein
MFMNESNLDDEQSFLIPTDHRAKLPKTMSYPIGAESVSETLAQVLQRDLLNLNFVFHSHFIKELERDSPFAIFEAEFTKFDMHLTASNYFIERGNYEEKWKLTVYPVPRQMKSIAKKLLLEKGLPRIAKWLATKRTPSWKTGRKTITILFDQAEESISFQEE